MVWIANREKQSKNKAVTNIKRIHIIYCDYTLKNKVHGTKFNFLIPIYLQPDGVNLWHFKLRLYDLTDIIVLNKLVINSKSQYDIGLQRSIWD